jgi:ABC-2 type transport system ATP-binding protein
VNVLRFTSVRKSFGDKLVLDRLSFSVGAAEVYGLLGPNGSGKSTAINILCNLLDPDEGTIEVAGRPAQMIAKTSVGVCPQEIALYRDLRPAENLRFFCDVYGLARSDAIHRVAALMQLFGLERFARTRVSALSGGWQRRLNIAVALVHSPSILVLDEPTAGLDVEARQELWQTIELLKKNGMTILLTTHHLDEAEYLCSRIGIMKDGRIAHEGTMAQLLSLVPAKAIALVEAPDPNMVTTRAEKLGWGVRHYAGRIACLLPQQVSFEEVVHALNGIGMSSVTLQRVSLEHAYLEVMHEGVQRNDVRPPQMAEPPARFSQLPSGMQAASAG